MAYHKGEGVPKNEEKELEYLYQAAESEEPNAMIVLGFHYLRRNNPEKDPQKSAKWFQRAAKIGHPLAKIALRHFFFYDEETDTFTLKDKPNPKQKDEPDFGDDENDFPHFEF